MAAGEELGREWGHIPSAFPQTQMKRGAPLSSPQALPVSTFLWLQRRNSDFFLFLVDNQPRYRGTFRGDPSIALIIIGGGVTLRGQSH